MGRRGPRQPQFDARDDLLDGRVEDSLDLHGYSAIGAPFFSGSVAPAQTGRDRPHHHGQGERIPERPGVARPREVAAPGRAAIAGRAVGSG